MPLIGCTAVFNKGADGEGHFEVYTKIEQNKNFVQLRGAEKRILAEMSVLAWLATKTSFVRIMGFYGSGSVKTLPVLLLYYYRL